LTLGIDGEEDRLGERLAQDMQEHPQQDETRDVVFALRGIGEERDQPDYQAKDESTCPRQVVGTIEHGPIVEDGCVATQDLGEDAVPEIVEELGDNDAERRGEHGSEDQRGPDARDRPGYGTGGFCSHVARC
jgi:hypothetical protein